MKGHIRKRGKKSWAIVLDLGRGLDGKRKQKWQTVRGSKADAEAELARLVNDIHTGQYVAPSRMKLGEFLDDWLANYAKLSVSPKTYERYEQIIERNIKPALGGYLISGLRPLHIQRFYTEAQTTGRKDGSAGLSAQTVLHFHRLLHRALGQAVKWQLLTRNPADAVEAPKPERQKMQTLDEGEAARLLQLVKGTKLYVPVVLAVTTGMRRGEILALKWTDVDFELGQLNVHQSLEQTAEGLRFKKPKTKQSNRVVTLLSFATDVLHSHKLVQTKERLRLGPAYQDRGLVCPRSDGTTWPPDSLSTAFATLIRRSDLPRVRFHDLRHTHATHLLRQGIHPKIVSERLGHSKVGITLDTYSHVLPGMQEDAASRLDAVLRVAMQNQPDNVR